MLLEMTVWIMCGGKGKNSGRKMLLPDSGFFSPALLDC